MGRSLFTPTASPLRFASPGAGSRSSARAPVPRLRSRHGKDLALFRLCISGRATGDIGDAEWFGGGYGSGVGKQSDSLQFRLRRRGFASTDSSRSPLTLSLAGESVTLQHQVNVDNAMRRSNEHLALSEGLHPLASCCQRNISAWSPGLAAFLRCIVSTTQSITSAQDIQGARAYHAARACWP
ncbi:MAG: hypothetical protein IPI89_05470 [Propionivibrio sp.]|nr:hypothetical protein [Propionivibrio sp.]